MDVTAAQPELALDVSEADVEAPILFERRGWYYLIYRRRAASAPRAAAPS